MTRKWILPLALLVLLLTVAVPKMAAHNAQVQDHRSAAPVVLPVYGHLNYFAGRTDNLLTLQLISGLDALDPARLQVDFPEEKLLSATVLDCIPVYTHNGYALWTLNLRVELSPAVQRCVVNQVTINGETHNMGNLDLEVLPQSNPSAVDYLSLCNNQVMLSGRGLQNYHLTVRNRTRFPMTLTQVSDPSYGGTPLELQLNGQPVAPELPLPLAPGDCLDITLALSRWPDSGQTGCAAYCVYPTLRYDYLGHGYALPMLPCFSDLSLSKEAFVALCGTYLARDTAHIA